MRTLLRLRTLADAVCIVLVRVAQIGQIVVGPLRTPLGRTEVLANVGWSSGLTAWAL